MRAGPSRGAWLGAGTALALALALGLTGCASQDAGKRRSIVEGIVIEQRLPMSQRAIYRHSLDWLREATPRYGFEVERVDADAGVLAALGVMDLEIGYQATRRARFRLRLETYVERYVLRLDDIRLQSEQGWQRLEEGPVSLLEPELRRRLGALAESHRGYLSERTTEPWDAW